MLRLPDQLDVYGVPLAPAVLRVHNTTRLRTGVLDAALRQDTVTPVGDTADSLHATGATGDWIVAVVASRASIIIITEVRVEAVLEMSAYLVPVVAVRVT